MTTINLLVGDIIITLGDPDPENPGAFLEGSLTSTLKEGDAAETPYTAAIDGMEALILAHAIAGINVSAPAYLEGIETTIEGIGNNMDDELFE